MTQDTMTFKREWYDAISVLPTPDMQADAALAIIRYAFTGDIDCDRPFSEALVGMIKDQIDISAKRREAGRAGGKSKANRKQNCSKSVANDKQSGSTPLSPSSLSPEPPITSPPISPSSTTTISAQARELEGAELETDPYGHDLKEKSCAKKESPLPSGTWVASEDLADWFLADSRWVQAVAKNKRHTEDEVRILVREFCTNVELTEDGKEVSDAKRHFINWLRKRSNEQQRTQQRPTRSYQNPEPDFRSVAEAVARGIAAARTNQG